MIVIFCMAKIRWLQLVHLHVCSHLCLYCTRNVAEQCDWAILNRKDNILYKSNNK